MGDKGGVAGDGGNGLLSKCCHSDSNVRKE